MDRSVKKQKLVVVGNGMAGMRTVEELHKLAPDLYDITVFGAEPHGNYNRILLSNILSGVQDAADIFMNPLDWYDANGITLHAGQRVVVVARFLALLELARRQAVVFEQLAALGELTIRWTGADDTEVEITDEFDGAPPEADPPAPREDDPDGH